MTWAVTWAVTGSCERVGTGLCDTAAGHASVTRGCGRVVTGSRDRGRDRVIGSRDWTGSCDRIVARSCDRVVTRFVTAGTARGAAPTLSRACAAAPARGGSWTGCPGQRGLKAEEAARVVKVVVVMVAVVVVMVVNCHCHHHYC